jgi:hypothetical protein
MSTKYSLTAQQRAARQRFLQREGLQTAMELEHTALCIQVAWGTERKQAMEHMALRIQRDITDDLEISSLKRAGATEADQRVQIIRLKMQARRNGVDV